MNIVLERMMEKKRSVGVVLWTIIMLIFGVISFLYGFRLISAQRHPFWVITFSLIIISGVVYIVSSIFLFRLKEWARKLSINCSSILLVYFIPLMLWINFAQHWTKFIYLILFFPFIIVPVLLILFLTHPKVKEQFSAQKIGGPLLDRQPGASEGKKEMKAKKLLFVIIKIFAYLFIVVGIINSAFVTAIFFVILLGSKKGGVSSLLFPTIFGIFGILSLIIGSRLLRLKHSPK